jgi:hypothetical protein
MFINKRRNELERVLHRELIRQSGGIMTQSISLRARALIKKLGLLPHPEGGHYCEIYRSEDTVQAVRGKRASLTTIYFLLQRGERSLFHCVSSDEVWHFYEGSPLKLIDVSSDMKRAMTHRVGPEQGRSKQVAVIAKDRWQAAESTGDFSLVGCTVAPGFDFQDFKMLKHDATGARRMRQLQPQLARFVG